MMPGRPMTRTWPLITSCAVLSMRNPGLCGTALPRVRGLQAVTDAAPQGQWCWAAQAAEALTAMQQLVSEAIRHGRNVVDTVALAAQVRLFRSAALIGANQTAARSGALMKKHRRQARPQLLRCPRHARQGRALDADRRLMSQQGFRYLTSYQS